MAQINRLDSRIDELAARLSPTPRIGYRVSLVWMQPDGSVVDSDGNPWQRRPGVTVLEFGHGHDGPA
jgi:hypothetical protein